MQHRTNVLDPKQWMQSVFSARSVNKGGVYASFRFEYEVGGAVYSAVIAYPLQMASYWQEGDTVPVLYDRDEPTKACFVYR